MSVKLRKLSILCAVAAALALAALFSLKVAARVCSRTPACCRVSFRYVIDHGPGGGTPFVTENKRWNDEFSSPSFTAKVATRCIEEDSCLWEGEEEALRVAGSASFELSNEASGPVCDFFAVLPNEAKARSIGKAYLDEMQKAVEESNLKVMEAMKLRFLSLEEGKRDKAMKDAEEALCRILFISPLTVSYQQTAKP